MQEVEAESPESPAVLRLCLDPLIWVCTQRFLSHQMWQDENGRSQLIDYTVYTRFSALGSKPVSENLVFLASREDTRMNKDSEAEDSRDVDISFFTWTSRTENIYR